MKIFEKLNEAYSKFQEELENENYDIQQEVYDLEQEVREAMEYTNGNELSQLNGLLKKIATMKKEYDFYDEDSEYDRMFPGRNDEDFDQDSMSPESVFGDD